MIGIYGIEDVETGNIYVGQSKDIKRRWSCHKANLKGGLHSYIELQEAYSLDCKRIKWTVLEECRAEDLEERESYWIKFVQKIDEWNLINKQKFGSASKKIADTTNMCKAQAGENNGHCCKLTLVDVIRIKLELQDGCKVNVLAEKYDVSRTQIYNIKNNKRWQSVQI